MTAKEKMIYRDLKNRKLDLHINYRFLVGKYIEAKKGSERITLVQMMYDNETEQMKIFKQMMDLEDDGDFSLDDYRNNRIT